mmetsp:Transcript_97452/g.278667  ORF Transcript_97452/g.278667 Transcript_97452/m.278667 type:complete len:129 (-) Transcript_97452:1059-1445(-)
MDGEWVAGGEYFKGAESGVNHLSDFSPKVDSVTRELIASKLAEIEAGSTDVFCGHVPLANGGAVVDNFWRSDEGTGEMVECSSDLSEYDSGQMPEECCLGDYPGLLSMDWYDPITDWHYYDHHHNQRH